MGIQPTSTMKIAQRLYEAGHITYMRTDSDVLSEEAVAAAQAWVTQAFGKEYLAGAGAAAAPKKKGKVQATQASSTNGLPAAQEAHEAIRPTHFEKRILPADEDWSAVDRKIYTLIWNRATQSVMAAAKGEKHTVKFVAQADSAEFIWQSIWKREIFAGWKKIGAAATDLDAEDGPTEAAVASSTAWTAAISLAEGDTVNWSKLEAAPHDARSPARFTEATLVRELERKGIGRPSTFASLVTTLHTKNYMEKRDTPAQSMEFTTLTMTPGEAIKEIKVQKKVGGEKNKLVPTALGVSALEFCLREFEPLFAYEFTKKMEGRLDGIATGAEEWKDLCRDTWGTYREKYTTLKEGKATVSAGPARERLFEGGIKAVQSKKGPLLLKEGVTKADGAVFYGWPEGRKFHEITEAQVAEFVASKRLASGGGSLGTYEGTPIVKKSGPHGPYASCGSVSVPWTEADTEETLQAKFKAKKENFLHRCGTFEFRNGPYGVYMFKTDQVGKARKFVGLPTGVDPKSLTLEAATKIFQTGLKAKATAKTFGKKNAAT
jgi:DNA topoisomerase-1